MASRSQIPLSKCVRLQRLIVVGMLYAIAACLCGEQDASKLLKREALQEKSVHLWPENQLNVLVDSKSFNQTELQIITRALEQLDRNTCLKVNKLSTIQNPFEDEEEESNKRNFLYLFKSNLSESALSNVRHPSIGLSSLGCIGSRQSLVLTDLAFKWPDVVLSYHLMRTLGVERLEHPGGQVRRQLNVLPLNQKISSVEDLNFADAIQTPVSTTSDRVRGEQKIQMSILKDEDLNTIKQLYNCSELQVKLLPTKLTKDVQSAPEPYNKPTFLSSASYDCPELTQDDEQLDKTTEQIANSLQEPPTQSSECKPLETCRLQQTVVDEDMRREGEPQENYGETFSMRPMILRLDDFHAQDPHLRRANQMKLIRGASSSVPVNESLTSSYRSLVPMLLPLGMQSQWNGNGGGDNPQTNSRTTSEMTISFEQASVNGGNQAANLASAQVLKLCSCSCQTMVPAPLPSTQPPPITLPPILSTYPTVYPTYATEYPSPPTVTTVEPRQTLYPTTSSTEPPTTTTTIAITTTTPEPTTTIPESTSTASTIEQATTLVPDDRNVTLPPMNSACDEVQWVQPNKTVYASAKIVWDVDRGNQNYFLCNSMLDEELIPGKTHGFSCKISQEGKAYEGHSFNVLTKPESVNLAWVNKSSTHFGTRNLPVIGGYSKAQDPYIVSRCLVKDENNDLITLIGYVNNQGVGWFPFDDIQIECSKYDVLACVS